MGHESIKKGMFILFLQYLISNYTLWLTYKYIHYDVINSPSNKESVYSFSPIFVIKLEYKNSIYEPQCYYLNIIALMRLLIYGFTRNQTVTEFLS